MFDSKKHKTHRRTQTARVELLEARVLYSADIAGGWVTDAADPFESNGFDPLSELALSAKNAEISTLVFVDTRTPDYDYFLQKLEQESSSDLKVVLLDQFQSGIEQVSTTLRAYSDIASIHFVSHNIGAGVALGSDIVDAEFVLQNTTLFNGWAASLTDEADLLFYGCNLAATDSGDNLVALLAESTGADIAASDDLTGSATHYPNGGADWALEVSSGSIETELFLAEGVLNEWNHTLGSITVTTAADIMDAPALSIADLLNGNHGADNKISLREAIVAANRTAGADIILLGADTYLVDLAGDGTPEDLSLQDDLDVTDDLTIIGQGPTETAIDGTNTFRVLETHNTALTLQDLTIKGGKATGPENGGGLLVNGGSTNLDNVVVSDNRVTNGGVGGGIYVGTATLNMIDSEVSGNFSDADGGGLYVTGMAIVTNSEISSNRSAGDGAGVRNYGTLELDGVLLQANVADSNGGAIATDGTTTISNSTFTLNDSDSQGGALFTEAAINLTIHNSTFATNRSISSDGGALHVSSSDLSVTHSTFSQNQADGRGGAIHLNNPASALISNSIFAGNTAADSFPAIEKAFTSSFNLVDTTVDTGNFNGLGDIVGGSANLAGLTDNGGPVPTMALQVGSHAIDSGQGEPRRDATGVLSNEFVDMGAFEYRTPIGAAVLRKIYWTDNTELAIYRANEDLNHQLSAVQKILGLSLVPEDLEFDESTRRLFWVEGTAGTARVQSADVDGLNVTELVSSALNPELITVRGIAVDADNNRLYVTSDAAGATAGTTDKIISYQLNTSGNAVVGAGTIVAQGTASSGTRMHQVNDVEVGTHPVTGHTQLLWSDTGVSNYAQTDKGYRHWNLDNGAKGSTLYIGPIATQLPASVAWNFNQDSFYQNDVITYQNIKVDPVTMSASYNGLSGYPSSASGLAYDAETDTLWISELGSGTDNGRIFTADSTINDGSEVPSLTGVNTPRALALASISRVSIAPVVSVNLGGLVDEGDNFSISNTQLLTSDSDDDPTDMTYSVVTAPQHGFLALSSNPLVPINAFTQADIDTGLVTYSHNDSENFIDRFEFEVTDGVEIIGSNIFNITITPVNDNFPITQSATMTVIEGGATTVVEYGSSLISTGNLNDLVTDIDLGDGTSFSVDTAASFGGATINSDGTFDYIHNGSENLTDSFVYAVEDSEANRSTGIVTITVSPENDAPVLSTIEPTPVSYTENDPSVALTASLSIGDLDDTNIETTTITISAGFDAGDTLTYTPQFGIGGTYDAANGILPLSGSATFAQYETVIQSIRYSHSGDNPSALNRTVDFVINDGDDNSNQLSRDIGFTPVNDAPVLSNIEALPASYTENGVPTIITGNISVNDLDDTNIESATISISGNFANGEDQLLFTDQFGITGNYVASTGVLTLSGPATLADYETALRSITYQNTSDNPSSLTRTVDFVIKDGDDNSNLNSRDITFTPVNDAPVLSAIEALPANYTENDLATIISGNISVNDLDDTNIESATISISGNFANGEDQLLFTDQLGITGNYVASTGVLLLSGPATLADYETALRTITYQNTSDNPSSLIRTVDFMINDADNNSNVNSRDIEFTAVNDAPVLSTIEALAANYTENGVPVTVTGNLSVNDLDDTNIESAAVTISGNFANGEDQLLFTNQLGITGNYVASTGILTLSGSATLADYETALRSITYHNTSDNPSSLTRTVDFIINDGDDNSNLNSRDIEFTPVNDAPVLSTIETLAANYTENGVPVTVTGNLSVNDLDDTNIESATVSISGNFANGEDQLLFTDQLGITGNYVASTGILTLSGSATLADYDTALRTITYQNTSDNPSSLTRTVDFMVNDGDDNSNLNSRDIEITAVNDAPVLSTIEALPASYTENDLATIVTGNMSVNDLDDTNIESATVTIRGNFASGEDQLLFTDQLGITGNYNAVTGILSLTGTATLADYATAIHTVNYHNTSNNPSVLNRTVDFTVNDGDFESNLLSRDIVFTATNDAPVLSAIESSPTAYIENSVPIGITSNLVVNDVDDTLIESATVSISGNFAAGEDNLVFSDHLGITGNYDAATGILTLTGSATLADYETALRTVAYQNTNDNPSSLTRTVDFNINDGDYNSNLQSRDITFTAVNDAPVLSTIEALAAIYIENSAPIGITGNLSVNDVDDVNIESATVSISSGLVTNEDLLEFINPNGSVVTGNYNSSTGVLSLSGSATLADFQEALRAVTYRNTSDNPDTQPRTISFVINDDDLANSTPLTRDIEISPVNDLPVGATDAITVAEGGLADRLDSGHQSVLFNDTDVDLPNDTLSSTVLTDPAVGSLTLNLDGTFSYLHDGSENHSDSFQYTLTDGAGNSDTVLVNITVTPVNDNFPVTQDATMSVSEGGLTTVVEYGGSTISTGNLNDLVTDVDTGDSASFSVDTTATFGSLIINSDGTFEYIHDGSENSSDSFVYAVVDSGGNPSTGTVTITVTPVNDSVPVGATDTIGVAEGGVATSLVDGQNTVLANDADADLPNDALEATVLSSPVFGSLLLNPDGSFSYQHDGSENHSDNFQYTLQDAVGNSDTVLVNIAIAPVNDNVPVAQNATMTVGEGGTSSSLSYGTSVTGDLNDLVTDLDIGDDTSFSIDTAVAFGNLTINTDGAFEYIHDGSENFTDSFVYAVEDLNNNRTTGVVSIIVSPVNDHVPIVQDDVITVAEGGSVTSFDSGRSNLLQGLIDPDIPDTASVSLLTDVSNGLLVIHPDNRFEYTHDGSEQFSDSFSYNVTDAAGQTDTVTVAVNITPVNDPPAGQDNVLSIPEDSVGIFKISDFGFSDTPENNNFESIVISSVPSTGQLQLNGVVVSDGDAISVADVIAERLTYHPLANYHGVAADTFGFQVVDDGGMNGGGQNKDGTPNAIAIDLASVNDYPVARETVLNQSVVQDLAYQWFLPTELFEDIDGDTLLFNITQSDGSALPAWLSFEQLTNTLYGVPGYADVGTLNLAVVAQDGAGLSASLPLNLTVTEFNSPPNNVAIDNSTVLENQPGVTIGNISVDDIDIQDTHVVTIDDPRFIVVNGELSLIPGSSLDFETEPEIDLLVTTTDSADNTFETMVQLAVLNANDIPVPSNTDIETTGTAPFSLTLPVDFFTDEDNDTLSYSVTLFDGSPLPDWITFDPATRTIAVANNAPGVESIMLAVIASDENGDSASESLSIVLQPVAAAAQAVIDPRAIETNDLPSYAPLTSSIEADNRIESAPDVTENLLASLSEPLAKTLKNNEGTAIQLEPVLSADTSPVVYQATQNAAFDRELPKPKETVEQTKLPIEVIQPMSELFLENPLEYDKTYSNLASNLDQQRSVAQDQQVKLQIAVSSSIAVSSGFTVGYIVWLLRGGILLSSVLTSLPAWRSIDPLPILHKLNDDHDADDETLESMVESDQDEEDDSGQSEPVSEASRNKAA